MCDNEADSTANDTSAADIVTALLGLSRGRPAPAAAVATKDGTAGRQRVVQRPSVVRRTAAVLHDVASAPVRGAGGAETGGPRQGLVQRPSAVRRADDLMHEVGAGGISVSERPAKRAKTAAPKPAGYAFNHTSDHGHSIDSIDL